MEEKKNTGVKSGFARGVLLALGTAVLWGGTSPISKYIGSHGVSMVSVMCYRALLVVLLVGAWLRYTRGRGWYRISRSLLNTYMLLGLLTVVINACGFMISCVYLTVPQALMLHYTFPLATMAGSLFITGEPPLLKEIAAGVAVLAGLYIGFTGEGGGLVSVSVPGLLWGVASVAALAAQTLISRRMLRDGKSDPVLQLFFIHLFGGIILAAAKTIFSGWEDLKAVDGLIFVLMQYAAIASGLGAFWLMFSALKYIGAPLVSLICTLELVFALIITALVLRQPPTLFELAGCAIITAAVAFAASGKKTPEARDGKAD